MKALKRWMLFGAVLLMGAEAEARDFTIEGVVRDEKTGEILVGANVQLDGRGMATDERGRFRFTLVDRGERVVSVSFVGYYVYKDRIQVDDDQDLQIPGFKLG